MKSYCTQNNGDCGTCSLVSYHKDCRNYPLLKCPKCGDYDCIKDGTKIAAGGRVPAARCGGCGYRGSSEKF
ncbi:hypothetical protein [Methanoregula sp.]|uniref:hypothetical protein n=1 Tax=Methanoregula sp. TaxID=2052170 RepID=UPI0035650286